MPANTHFNSCDAIIPFEMLAEFWSNPELLTTDSNSSFGLYFLAKEGTELQSKAQILLEDLKKNYWVFKEGFSTSLEFEPLTLVLL